jgi:hypothetical protein
MACKTRNGKLKRHDCPGSSRIGERTSMLVVDRPDLRQFVAQQLDNFDHGRHSSVVAKNLQDNFWVFWMVCKTRNGKLKRHDCPGSPRIGERTSMLVVDRQDLRQCVAQQLGNFDPDRHFSVVAKSPQDNLLVLGKACKTLNGKMKRHGCPGSPRIAERTSMLVVDRQDLRQFVAQQLDNFDPGRHFSVVAKSTQDNLLVFGNACKTLNGKMKRHGCPGSPGIAVRTSMLVVDRQDLRQFVAQQLDNVDPGRHFSVVAKSPQDNLLVFGKACKTLNGKLKRHGCPGSPRIGERRGMLVAGLPVHLQ